MKFSINKMFLAIFVLFFSGSYQLYAMEIAGIAEEAGAALERAGLESGEVFNMARSAIEEEFGNLTKGEMANLPEDVRATIKEKITSIADEIEAKFAGEKEPGLEIKKDMIDKVIGPQKIEMFDQLMKDHPYGFDEFRGSLFEKMPGVPKQFTDLIGAVDIEHFDAYGIGFKPDPEVPEEPAINREMSQAHENVLASEKNIQNLYETGGSPDAIDAAQNNLKKAQKNYETKSQKALKDGDTRLENARRAEIKAKDALENASSANVDEAQKSYAKAREGVSKAKKASQNAIKEKAFQDFRQAEEARNTARDALENTKKISKDTSGYEEKVQKAQKAYDDAKTKYSEARQELVEKGGWDQYFLTKGGRNILDASEDLWENVKTTGKEKLWEGLKSAPGKAWEGVKKGGKAVWEHSWTQGFIQGFIFTFPNMVLDSIESYFKNQALLDTFRTVQSFGNVLMKLIDDFINEADPANSLFIYVGIPNKDQELTKEFLLTAHYYTSISDYGEVAQNPIAGSSTPAYIMLDLNTGYRFVGDGIAYDDEQPTIPLIVSNSRSSQSSLKEILDELGGRAKKGPEGKTYQYYQIDRPTGYAGNATIASLFDSPTSSKDSYPPLLQRTVTTLQNGTKFGNFLVQGIRGFGSNNKNDKAMWNLITTGATGGQSNILAPYDEPYVAREAYIYQTKDTPFIKNIRSAIAPEDLDAKIAAQDLVDYVIILNHEGEIVPLQTPQPQPPSHYASYALNLDAAYMVSLIDPSFARYAKDGTVSYMQSDPQVMANGMEGIKGDPENQKIMKQIQAMQQFVDHQAQFGPFSYGSANLTIAKNLIDKKIYIYKIPGYLGKDIDDYVIAIAVDENKEQQVVQLPTAVQFFISLVTNKIYDGAFKPTKATLKYFIVQQPGATAQQVTTDLSKFPSGTQTICSGNAPLHTLFVAGPFNPTKCTDASKKEWTLPNENNWALTQYSLVPQSKGKKENIETYLEHYDQDLLNAINHSQSLWQATIDKKDPDAVARQMGPFDFTSGLVNIQLTAVSEAAIMNQNFVYVSDFYPDQYLVLAEDAHGAEVGKAFNPGNPQKYLVSLSNGYVYSALAQEDKGVGERVGNVTLDLQAILNQAQNNSNKYIDELLVKIKHSEAIYNAKIVRNLYGPDLSFAQFKFYLAKPDYFSEQYIYQDVTQLGAPLDDQGNEVKAVTDQVDNYFIAIERTALPDSCAEGCPPAMDEDGKQMTKDGKPLYWHYSFNTKLSPNTYAVASLISGATYDRENTYLGSYDQFMIKKSGITDILGFTTRMLADIAKKSGKPVRDEINKKIIQLTGELLKRIKAEEKELADAKEQQDKLYTPLSSTIKADLDRLKSDGTPVIPYIDNPNLLPRYLKFYNGKYYAVTPGYMSTPKPKDSQGNEIKISEYAPGPDRTYIDYNLSSILGKGKDSYMGMVYDSDGNARLLLGPDKKWVKTTQMDPKLKKDVTTYKKTLVGPGWQLTNARAYAGIEVGPDGKETRVIGMNAPTIPMGDSSNPTKYLKSTGFDQLKDPTNNNQYDFYYHTQIDSYFVKVQTSKSTFYINLSSGYAYNADGSPRWFEKPIYKSKDTGDTLFIGTDEFGILKVALYIAKDKAFSYYTMVGNFAAQITKAPYNARGIYCTMVSDQDPDRKIQLFEAQKDAKTQAPLSYYLVWDVSTEGQQVSLGQFLLQEDQFYSLLLYAQTRNKGDAVEKGTFVAADNYIDPSADVKKPKTVGIVFGANHKITQVIYQDQLCVLQGNTILVKNQDGTTRTVTITQNKKSLQPAHASSIPGLTAQWISFEDGSKIYDYFYDLYILNPQQEVITADKPAQHLNLYNLKHGNPNLMGRAGGGFGLNVSSFIPPTELRKEKAAQTGPKEAMSGVALASYLQANQDVDEVLFPPSVKSDTKNKVLSNVQNVKLDDSNPLFINNLVSGPTKRYVYVYGQGQDIGQVWAAPGLFKWSVDLANGILYDQDGFPAGLSLMPMQLYALLDTLQVNVTYDDKGVAHLAYRTMSADSSQHNLSQAYPALYETKTTPKPMATLKSMAKPQAKKARASRALRNIK